jgi:hypothetical protein
MKKLGIKTSTSFKNKKKGQIIKTLTLKWKVKRHYMKRDDGVSTVGKKQNNSLFLLAINNFLSFSIFRMNVEESFVEKLQKNSK